MGQASSRSDHFSARRHGTCSRRCGVLRVWELEAARPIAETAARRDLGAGRQALNVAGITTRRLLERPDARLQKLVLLLQIAYLRVEAKSSQSEVQQGPASEMGSSRYFEEVLRGKPARTLN
eukprot:6208115-Pleurochrysis_carterae.AAC.3